MKVYRIATKQNVRVFLFNFFGKHVGDKLGYVIRGEQYYYCDSVEDAIKKYTDEKRHNYSSLKGWTNWISCSDNINICIHENQYKIIDKKVIQLDYEEVSIEYLKEHMDAEDFRAWWYSHD